MILVVGSPHDRTTVHTLRAARRCDVPYLFFDIVRFLRWGEYAWDFEERCGYLSHDEVTVHLPDPRIPGIYVRLVDISEQVDVRDRSAVRARMRALTEILVNVDTPVVNRPGVDMSNWAKAYHLQLLSRCGFTVPRSLLTNDENQALEFLKDVPSAIFKGASGEKTIASAFEPRLRSRLKLLDGSPVLFQERVPGVDVRTHLIGSRLVSQRIESEGVNYVYSRGAKVFTPTEVPKEIAGKCLAYQASSGLTFIGFDFIVTEAGEYTVLEANPMPGYDVYDRRLGLAISRALLDVLQG